MEVSKDFKNNLINNGVKWVYLSIDKKKDIDKWRTKSAELEDLGLLKNQFVINQAFLSKFSSFFNLSSGIPKYIIFNKKGELILFDGPRPTGKAFFQMVINQLE
jgi:hypothetical protein